MRALEWETGHQMISNTETAIKKFMLGSFIPIYVILLNTVIEYLYWQYFFQYFLKTVLALSF